MNARTFILSVSAILLSFSLCEAQSLRWEQFHGPYGGQLYRFLGLLVDDESGDIYVGRMDGILHTSDSGLHWDFDCTGRVLVHVVCFNARREIVAGTQYGIMFRDPAGGDWQSCPETEPFAIWSLVSVPDSGILLAGCADGTLLRSTDHGRNWQIRSINRNVSCSIDQIIRTDSNLLCAGTATQGAWLSTDAGLTWNRTGEGSIPAQIRSAITDDGGNILLICGVRTLSFSTDRGKHWAAFPLPVDSQNSATALCHTPDGHLFLGTDDGIFSSNDLGRNWHRRSMGLSDSEIGAIAYSDQGSYFVIATSEGIFRSFTGEAPWELIGTPLENPYTLHVTRDGLLLVSTMLDMAITSNGGKSWYTTGLRGMLGIDEDETRGILYAGGRRGMYRSTDRGVTWESTLNDLGSSAVYSIVVLPDGNVIVGTTGEGGTGGIYVSSDQGKHWEPRNEGLGERDIYWIERNKVDGTLYASTVGGTFYRSNNDGVTWWMYPRSFDLYPCITVDANGRVILGTQQGGVHLSTDRGTTWSRISTELLDAAIVNWVEADRTGGIFVGCGGDGIFSTSDDGTTWIRMNDGLRDSIVMCLTLDERQFLYAGTMYGGIFRSAEPTVVGRDPLPFATATHMYNFPNPFSTQTLISIHSSSPAQTLELKLYDAAGRMIMDLSQNVRAHPLVRLTRSMLPSVGLYFIQLTTPKESLSRPIMCIE